jgi:glycosyltransferase involved in cell wall biosynthesis
MTQARRKVLFLFPFPSLGGGGAQRVFSTLLRHLDRKRFDLHLALLRPERCANDEIPRDVTVHDLGASRTRYTITKIAALVRTLKPQIVISTLGHMNIALLLSKRMGLLPRRTRILIRESTTPSVFLKQGTGHPRIWSFLYRWLYKQADAVICLSDAMAKDLAENFNVPRKKLVRIFNPVDTTLIRQMAQTGGNPYRDEGPHLVAAGRFYREKGFDLLIQGLPRVLASFPRASLTLLGSGPLESELRLQAERLSVEYAVSFPGMQQNPWRYLANADLVIVPSRYDGLPNVPLEALALGTPVLATDCPGAIREIKENNDRVTLVTPENPEALAEGIVEALKRPRIMAQAPADLKKFSVAQSVEQYMALFELGGPHNDQAVSA